MEIKDSIIIAKDFSNKLGARYIKDGPFSGQLFLQDHLRPKFEKAINGGYILLIDLDKVYGYPSSFVSGSFGILSLEKSSAILLKHIEFKSEDNPIRLQKIIREINNPKKVAV